MIKKILIALAGFIAVVLSLGAIKVAQIKEMQSMNHAQPAASVSTVPAKMAAWAPTLRSIGTLAPVRGVTLSAESEGALMKIAVENGAWVQAGDVLFEIDSSVERAQLKATEAQRDLAKLNANRAVELREKQTISQAELDQASAQLNQAEANVAALLATLEKKTVRAPFAGRIGIRLVNLGQFINRGQAIVQLQDTTSLYVNFSLPQRQLPEIKVGQAVKVVVDAFGDRNFTGTIQAIEPAVDSSTRNVSVQALIKNEDESLRSGMFARVEVELPAGAPAIVLPATAIAYAAYGNSVYIVEKMKDDKGNEYTGVRQQFVTVGDRKGDQVSILHGVKEGEEIVSAGVFKLRNSLPVQINNTVQPSNNPTPKPVNS